MTKFFIPPTVKARTALQGWLRKEGSKRSLKFLPPTVKARTALQGWLRKEGSK
jgi:Rps23 Pro-64 3,4-dihydroxylase Tpa1-like proline 4-hydroxylase